MVTLFQYGKTTKQKQMHQKTPQGCYEQNLKTKQNKKKTNESVTRCALVIIINI